MALSGRSQVIETLIRNAHRRSLCIAAAEQAAVFGAFVCAGAALMLLLGTQLLNWYWLVLIAGSGAALSLYRLRRRVPAPYDTAQLLDKRLSLYDTISTAWHVNRCADIADTEVGRWQVSHAESLAAGIDSRSVFPFRFHRLWILTLVLAVVALALFSVRYLTRRDLSFQQSLIPLRFERLNALLAGLGPEQGAERGKSASDTAEGENRRQAATQQDSQKPNDVVGVKNPLAASKADNAQGQEPNSLPDPSGGQAASSPKQPAGDAEKNAAGESHEPKAGQEAKGAEQSGRSQSNDGQDNKSLADRMKDAVSSFLAKLKPEEASQSAQATARNAAAPDQDQTQNESGKSQSQSGAPQQSSPSNSRSSTNNSQEGQATEMSDSAQSQSSGSSERKASNESKSGVGKQDGSKELKQTEEAAAMGKLAEIIGKRSHDISGEMMVEVPSGRQELKTSYSGKVAQHADTGGEINRDEVPLALQDYVRSYMERVHRDATTKQDGAVKR